MAGWTVSTVTHFVHYNIRRVKKRRLFNSGKTERTVPHYYG
jgi:hypothetical protein